MTMDMWSQTKHAYIVAVVGVALLVVVEAYGVVRALLIRQMFRGRFGPVAARQFVGPFGAIDFLLILAVVITIVGLAWLGLNLVKSSRPRSGSA